MKRSYSPGGTHPAMRLSISFGEMDGPLDFSVEAMIDTGAAFSGLPEELLRQLKRARLGSQRVRGAFDEDVVERRTRLVRIQLGIGPQLDVDVLELPGRRALIGRDVLNECVLMADGPQELFELSFGSSSV